MPITLDQYTRKATMDARSAMAMALVRHLNSLVFQSSGGSFQFTETYSVWPSYLERFVPPVACVLPSSWKYADALFTPTLLEDTWEVSGEPGFGLYKISEVELDFEVSIRTTNIVEREQIIRGIEESFVDPKVLMSEAAGPRYGIMLPLPEYYGLEARVALTGARMIDAEDTAMRENRDAVFTLHASCDGVRVGPVYPLDLTLRFKQCDS